MKKRQTYNSKLLPMAKTMLAICLSLAVYGCASTSDSMIEESELAEADLFDGLEGEAELGLTEEEYAGDAIVEGDNYAGSSYGYYYVAVGGESLGRLAYALYDSRAKVNKVKQMNQSLAVNKKAKAGQRVYFDMETASPRPEHLTKDMIERYKTELIAKIKSKREKMSGNEELAITTVQSGDTLQMISDRLYGTTRLWTELFILNQDKLKSYDDLRVGMQLNYFPASDFRGTQKSENTFANNEASDEFQDSFSDANSDASVAASTPETSQTTTVVEEENTTESTAYVAANEDNNTASDMENTKSAVADSAFADSGGSPPDDSGGGGITTSNDSGKKTTISKTKAGPASPPTFSGVKGGEQFDPDKKPIAQGIKAESDAATGGVTEKGKMIRPGAGQGEQGGFFAQNLRKIIYVLVAIVILVGGYMLTRPKTFKRSSFGGIQPMPGRSSAPGGVGNRPRVGPGQRSGGASSGPPPRPGQKAG